MNEQQFNAIPKTQRFNQVLEGDAYYFAVQSPNTSGEAKFGGPVYYGGFLALKDEAEVAKAEAMGLKILPATDKIPAKNVKVIRKLTKKEIAAGTQITEIKPQVIDSKQKPVPKEILIGNGSKVLIKFGTYWFPNNGGGVGTMLSKVQIRELVPYTRQADSALVMDENGFSVEDSDFPDVEETVTTTVAADTLNDPLPWETSAQQESKAPNTPKATKTAFDD